MHRNLFFTGRAQKFGVCMASILNNGGAFLYTHCRFKKMSGGPPSGILGLYDQTVIYRRIYIDNRYRFFDISISIHIFRYIYIDNRYRNTVILKPEVTITKHYI